MDDISEDLILYEATLMVRKTPTKLNLNLNRPMKSRGKAVGETKEVLILRIIVFVLWPIVLISGFYLSLAGLDDCQLVVQVLIGIEKENGVQLDDNQSGFVNLSTPASSTAEILCQSKDLIFRNIRFMDLGGK